MSKPSNYVSIKLPTSMSPTMDKAKKVDKAALRLMAFMFCRLHHKVSQGAIIMYLAALNKEDANEIFDKSLKLRISDDQITVRAANVAFTDKNIK